MTKEECEEISYKIDAEGFDYYFTSYGADSKLIELMGKQIQAYVRAKEDLEEALVDAGIEVDL